MKDYKFRNNTEKRRYELDLEDGQLAIIDYVVMPDEVIALTHTQVPYEHENEGIGTQIVEKALTDIRNRGGKIIPQCGFVASYIRRHPQWNELIAVRESAY